VAAADGGPRVSRQDLLEDTVALVTGGARGIGAAIAAELQRVGATVAVVDREPAAAQSCALSLGADVTDVSAVGEAVANVTAELGRVDVLVNNAGILHQAALVSTTEEDWLRTIDVNLSGTFRVTREVLPGMLERGWGRIVNLASITPLRGEPTTSAYAASKGGVIGLTRALAREVAHRGVTVNAVAPGFVRTEQTREAFEGPTGDYVRGLVPMGRLAEPEDIVGTVVHLASPASTYVTGQVLVVDGGVL
jgi:NAD(P)-dependent dehydrogenase (short-subunit alcohol dehydrogenase family)